MTFEVRPVETTSPSRGELLAVLRRGPAGSPHATHRPLEIERSPSPYRSSFRLEEVGLILADGGRLPLLLKHVAPGALSDSARAAKPPFLLDPRREPEVYRLLLADKDLGTPAVYGATADARRGRFWLLLERVEGVELYQVGAFEVWKEVARWLARMHQRFAADPALPVLAGEAHLIRYDVDFFRTWIDRAIRFTGGVSTLAAADRRALARMGTHYDRLIEPLVELPTTLLHGEFYPSNILVRTDGKAPLRVCPVDWEMAALGPGLIDLAALVAGGWTEAEKAAIAQAYYAQLVLLPTPVPPHLDFALNLRRCRLHLAVQWLGWAPGWSPPAEHAQNWLAEALGTAAELELI